MSEKDVLYVIASEIEEELSCFAKEIDGSKSDIKIWSKFSIVIQEK